MPNFPPLRNYVFSVVDRWIATHKLVSPFLEIGAGTGALAEHLAECGWEGTAVDSSPHACKLARERLAHWPRVAVVEGELSNVKQGVFMTTFLMDVLEHVKDDEGLLKDSAERLLPGGAMILLVPVNPNEWSNDDEIYGHFRRYEWRDLEEKLKRVGLETADRWNVTFPVIWLLRRIYLRFLPSKASADFRDRRTAASSFYNPWDENRIFRYLTALFGGECWWRPLFSLQNAFSASRRGHAAMFLARKPGR